MNAPSVKTCFKCGATLPLGAFYRHPEMADGHLNKCKACTKTDVKRRYRDSRPERAAYDRQRNQRPERKASRARHLRAMRARNPEKYRAREAVAHALASGAMERRPCEVCGSDGAEAHHTDYSRPLDVRWLCKRHHFAAHGKESRT